MAAKNAVAKTWNISLSYDGRRWSSWPAGDKPVPAPLLVSSTVNAAGTTLKDIYTTAVQFGSSGSGGRTLTATGGAAALTYASGSGSTTLLWTINRTVSPSETGTTSYTQPGSGLQAVGAGNAALASFASVTIINNSTVGALQGVVGVSHPLTLLTTAYGSTVIADTAAAITANTSSVARLRAQFNNTVTSPNVYGVTSTQTAVLGASNSALADSGQNYVSCCVNNATGVYGVGNDSPGVVSGITAFIDAETAAETAYNGSNRRPYWCADNFYNSRSIMIDICVAYDWLNSTFTQAQKTKVITYVNKVLTQLWSASPVCNGFTVNPSYALMYGLNPADNYFYGHMIATMLGYTAFGADNAQGSTWRTNFVNMVQNNLIPFLNTQTGGASLEGTNYGLFEQLIYVCFDWWYRSTGEDIFALFNQAHWDNKLTFWAHTTTPDLRYMTNWGDHPRESSSALWDNYRVLMLPIMQHYPTAATSQNMKALLAAATSPVSSNLSLAQCNHYSNAHWDLINTDSHITAGAASNFGLSFKDDISGYAMIRTGWTANDTGFYCSYGYHSEDHDHNDKGSFTIYKKSWLSADINLNVSSGEQQFSDVVNMVNILVGGTLRQPIYSQGGAKGTAPTVLFWNPNANGYWYLSVDYSVIWATPITTNKREYLLFPVGTNFVVLVFDHIVSSAAATKRWQINAVYTPTISTTTHANDTALITGIGSVTQKLTMIEPVAPALTVTPWTAAILSQQQGDTFGNTYSSAIGAPANTGSRIECSQTANDVVFLSVIDVNGCLTSAVQGTNTAGTHQVILNFVGGTTKTVTFFEANTAATVV